MKSLIYLFNFKQSAFPYLADAFNFTMKAMNNAGKALKVACEQIELAEKVMAIGQSVKIYQAGIMQEFDEKERRNVGQKVYSHNMNIYEQPASKKKRCQKCSELKKINKELKKKNAEVHFQLDILNNFKF